MNLKRSHYLFLMALLILGLYWPLISSGLLTSYDDQMLVWAVEKIKHFKDYFPAILEGDILDLQPMRDLSYQIDLWLGSILKSETFYFTNAFLLFWQAFFLVKLLENDDEKPDHLAYLLALVYISSPLVMSSAGWVAARKHMLAALFILLANISLIKKKNNFLAVFFYVLSMFSHPINLFWPVFAGAYTWFLKKEKNLKLIFSLALSMIFFLSLNIFYYQGVFVKWSGGDGKFSAESSHNLGLSLLALGRYFYTTFIPVDYLPTSFFEGAWENLAGLAALLVFILWLYKKYKNEKEKLLYLLLFFLPLIPVTLSITRIFASQTYLLSSLPGLFLFLKSEGNKTWLKRTAFIYLIVHLFCSIHYASILGHSDSLFRFAYKKEKSPLNIIGAITADIKEHRHAEAEAKIDELVIYDQENRFIAYFRVQNIYGDSKLSETEKIARLEKKKFDVPYYYLILSLLYANQNREEDFKKTIVQVYASTEKYIFNSYLDNEKALALYRIACEKFNYADVCKKNYVEFSKKTQLKNWDPVKYARYYSELTSFKDKLSY